MGGAFDDVVGPVHLFDGPVLYTFNKMLLPHFAGFEFIKHRMIGPASDGHHLARPDGSGHNLHGLESVLSIPGRQFKLIFIALHAVAAHLDKGTGSCAVGPEVD